MTDPAATTGDIFPPVPFGSYFGENPAWIIVSASETEALGAAPEGYFLPNLDFLLQNQDAIIDYVNTVIGTWAIVAFEGGKLGGTGYDSWGGGPLNVVETEPGQADDYYVYDDPAIDDVLLVAVDPALPEEIEEVPVCDFPGWECSCSELDPVDPFSRIPVPDNGNYHWWHWDYTLFDE